MSHDDFDNVHTITVDERSMAYRRAGRGTPVVLLHGIPTNSLLWLKVQRVLASDHEVLAPDLIGYGQSDKPHDVEPSVANNARWVTSFIEACCARPVVLVGHDIGGGIAQLVTANRPELVDRLVLVDTVAYDSWPEPNIARLKDPAWDERFQTIDLHAGFQRGLQRGMVDSKLATDELAALYADPFLTVGATSYLRAARALRTDDLLDATAAIERIAAPTTIVWGADDHYQNIDYGRRLADNLPNSLLIVLERVGHFVPEEAPDELAAIISRGAGLGL